MHLNNSEGLAADGRDRLHLDLRLEVSGPRPLSPERQARWAALLSVAAAGCDAPYLIFLGELLESLDPGEDCRFACEAYASPGEPGRTAWTLATRRLSLTREVDLPQASRLETLGFPLGMGLEWDGKLDGPFPMAVVVRGIAAPVEECLLALAHELFARAAHERYLHPELTKAFWGEDKEVNHE